MRNTVLNYTLSRVAPLDKIKAVGFGFCHFIMDVVRHGKPKPTAFFALRSGRRDLANAPCHGGTHIVMRLCKPARELSAVSQEQTNMVKSFGPRTGGLEIEADLMGAVVVRWPKGVNSPLGLLYGIL